MLLKDIKQYLQEQEVTLPVFLLNLPMAPTDCLVLYEYEGLPVEQQAGTVSPGLQVLLRTENETLEANYQLLNAVEKILSEIGFEDGELPEGVTINNEKYLRVYPASSGIIPLGKDDNGANIFTKNFYVIKEI